jgi:hypothetical protein
VKRAKFILDLSADEKSALRANFNHFSVDSVLFNRLKTMTTKQRISIFSDEYHEFEKYLLLAINDSNKYPTKQGKEWGSLQKILIKLRASVYV